MLANCSRKLTDMENGKIKNANRENWTQRNLSDSVNKSMQIP